MRAGSVSSVAGWRGWRAGRSGRRGGQPSSGPLRELLLLMVLKRILEAGRPGNLESEVAARPTEARLRL